MFSIINVLLRCYEYSKEQSANQHQVICLHFSVCRVGNYGNLAICFIIFYVYLLQGILHENLSVYFDLII